MQIDSKITYSQVLVKPLESKLGSDENSVSSHCCVLCSLVPVFKGSGYCPCPRHCLLIAGRTERENRRVGGKKVLENLASWYVRTMAMFSCKSFPSLL